MSLCISQPLKLYKLIIRVSIMVTVSDRMIIMIIRSSFRTLYSVTQDIIFPSTYSHKPTNEPYPGTVHPAQILTHIFQILMFFSSLLLGYLSCLFTFDFGNKAAYTNVFPSSSMRAVFCPSLYWFSRLYVMIKICETTYDVFFLHLISLHP
jgi:hypothetical protein